MVRIPDQSLHRRKYSEEIDVFEAAKYFSGSTNEIYPSYICSSAPLGVKDGQGNVISLLGDSMKRATQTMVIENQSKEKKHKKLPSSPGAGRIAKIMNAVFNQTSLKKGKSVNEKSHTNRAPMTSKASSSSKDFRCYTDHEEISPYSFINIRSQSPANISIGLIKAENLKHGCGERFDVEVRRYTPLPGGWESTKTSELDDDSDSSSDLFDLPNCDGNLGSCELPVYETRHIQSIKTHTR